MVSDEFEPTMIELGRTASVKREADSLGLEMVSYASVYTPGQPRSKKWKRITLIGNSPAEALNAVAALV